MVTGYDRLPFLFGVVCFLYRTKDVTAYATFFAIGRSTTTLRFRAVRDGKLLANQLVYGRSEDLHGHDAGGGHLNTLKIRTAADGTGTLRIDGNGKWYLSLIDMRKAAEPGFDYESNWATVTFQVR